jgi:ATP-dependent DNA helicase RecG
LALSITRRKAKSETGISFRDGISAVSELTSQLSFTLTNAQARAIEEIRPDMEHAAPMNRLLQGDVGSGKTAVAMAALLIAVRNGYQAAIMAPTEILAEQHYRSIGKIMDALGVPVRLLTGSSHTAKAKSSALAAIANGDISIVVGTHALIQEAVNFKRLGLAVIDEQHRFGVLQRAVLRQKGVDSSGFPPDVLVMTATPIPRTLTLTLYGDLDVTVLDELPPGRKPVKTHWKYAEQRSSVYETVRKLVAQGRQAYVLCALVSESEKLQARAATDLADHLSIEIFPEFKVGLLHGQMKSIDKEAAMDLFRGGETQILVSTTVIEVGVDVPNASIMVIEDADRFGLAQLHQLRGRVGRGSEQSYCILIADPKSNGVSERLAVMEQTTDGFEIAEADLEMRGPGEFFGTRQSGVELLPFADIVNPKLILEARDDANLIIAGDPNLELPEHAGLRAELDRRIQARVQDIKSSN